MPTSPPGRSSIGVTDYGCGIAGSSPGTPTTTRRCRPYFALLPGSVRAFSPAMWSCTHTVDGFNGNPSLGVGNYLFTSKVAAGPVTISGMVWDASLFYGTARPQDWALLVNNVVVDSGVLSGLISRSEAQTFDLNETLGIGGTVELELFQDPSAEAGFFVGAGLTVSTVPVPAPLIGGGVPAFLAVSGMLFGAKIRERSRKCRSLGTIPNA